MSTLVFNFQKTPLSRTLGVAKYTLHLAEALAAHHRLALLLRDDDTLDGLASFGLADAADVVRVAGNADVVDVPYDRADAVEIRAHHFQPRLTTLRSISLLHDFHAFDVPWKYANAEAMQDLLRECMRHSEAVVTEFPYPYFHYTRYTGLPATRLFLTGSPLLLGRAEDVTTEVTKRVASLPGKTLLYPAQLQQHKNHFNLVRALGILNRHQPVCLLLTGTGFDDRYTKQLDEEIARSGMRARVVHLGHVTDEEVMTLYKMVDATVVPSLAEGGAYVPLEALSVGCPVAVSDIPSVRYHLRSTGPTADVAFFDPTSPEAIAAAVYSILTRDVEPDKRMTVPELAVPEWSAVASDWNMIIEWVLGKRLRPHTQIDAAFRVRGLSDA